MFDKLFNVISPVFSEAEELITVTLGADGGTINGMRVSPPVGSRSPTTFRGASVIDLINVTTAGGPPTIYSFQVAIAGSRPQSFFNRIDVQDVGVLSATDPLVTYTSGSDTLWLWYLPAGPLPGGFYWPSSGTRTVKFYY